MKKQFVTMAKPVGSICNLRCEYCYYLETEYQHGKSPDIMSPATLEKYIKNYIESSQGPVVSFTWHGGEPTLAGLDFYEKAVSLQKKYLPKNWSCWNNLQTNGILLDDQWCAFLKKNNFDVGISIDGSKAVHDLYRKDMNKNGSYNKVCAAIKRLQNHGIRPDLLCTVTSFSGERPLEVYRCLREFETGWVQFIPIVRRNEKGVITEDSVTAEQYGYFLNKIFDEWIFNDLGKTDVQLFVETAIVNAGGNTSLCWMAPTCGKVLIVEQDGGIYSCDHFVDGNHIIGNVGSSDFADIIDSPFQEKFGNSKKKSLPKSCKECPWVHLCGGGCPKDRFSIDKYGENGLNYLCEGLKNFFSHSEKPLKKLMELKNAGLTPNAIMAEFRAEKISRFKGIGRNDPCPCGSGKKAKHCCLMNW